MRRTRAPSFVGLHAASPRASEAARSASAKTDTRCELVLRRELWRRRLRYRLHARALPGCPDIVFPTARVAVFCDGDFWHGRNLDDRLARLAQGHNGRYWTAKVRRNVERDMEHTAALTTDGWVVLRLWESDILRDVVAAADSVARAVHSRSPSSRGARR